MSLKKPALLLSLGLVFLLAACNDYTPTGDKYYTPLINEVYTNAASGQLQWVELYDNALDQNNTVRSVDISGWSLVTSQGSIPLRGVLDKTNKYMVIASNPAAYKTAGFTATAFDGSAGLGNLDPKNDAIVLKDENGQVIDQVGWGNPNPDTLSRLGTVGNIDLNLPAPADASKSLGRTPPGTVGDGVPPSNPGHFTVHDTLSADGPVRPDTSKYTFVLSTGTDVLTGIGGLGLWLAFVMIAFIARRFQELAQQKTYWELLLGAPVGVAIYDIILVVAYTLNHGSLENWQKWWAFTPLFLSGVFCLWVINIFRLIAKNILEAE